MSNHEFNVRGKIARAAAFIFPYFFSLQSPFLLSLLFSLSFSFFFLFGAVVPINSLFSSTDAVQKRCGEEIPLQFKESV